MPQSLSKLLGNLSNSREDYSLGDFKVVGDFLVRNNEKDSSENKEKYQFKNLLYKTEISQWLVESHKL